MSPNSILATYKFNFDKINYLYWKQTPQIDIAINKQNNTYNSFCNLYHGLKSNKYKKFEIEIEISTAIFKLSTTLQCKKAFFKRTFDCFTLYKKIEISDINEYNFGRFDTLNLCLKYKNQNVTQYYYICIPVLDQKKLKKITSIKQFKKIIPIKSDKMYPKIINYRLRAAARLVISKFLPDYLSLFLTPSIDDRTELSANLKTSINKYMIRCTIKYMAFGTYDYISYNKTNLYEWADALDHTCNSPMNTLFYEMLMDHEGIPEFVAARNLIIQNLRDVCHQYFKTQNKFLKDSNEDSIILQRGEYYFENDQTKYIQEIIERFYK
ncbi:hypothetical protein COBT_003367 [Conglomerata obtusa]